MPSSSRFTWASRPDAPTAVPPPPPVAERGAVSSEPPLPPFLADRLPPPLAAVLTDRIRGCLSISPSPAAELEEIRLRAGRYTSFTVGGRNIVTDILLDAPMLSEVLAGLCGGSLYAYSQDIARGFFTLPGGIRVGVAGRAVCEDGKVMGVRDLTGLCIRLPHRHHPSGDTLCRLLREHLSVAGDARGLLLFAPPGVGKTTLLRGMAVTLASPPSPLRTVLVDTREELGFGTEAPGLCLDVLAGYPRSLGVEIATRTLGAQVIICDEVGDCEEAMALVAAHHGGVPLVATAHAAHADELLRRTGLRLLHEARLFFSYVGLSRDGAGGFSFRILSWDQADALLS